MAPLDASVVGAHARCVQRRDGLVHNVALYAYNLVGRRGSSESVTPPRSPVRRVEVRRAERTMRRGPLIGSRPALGGALEILIAGATLGGDSTHLVAHWLLLSVAIVGCTHGKQVGIVPAGWPYLMVGFAALQVAMWFVLGQYGVSLVFSGLAGILGHSMFRRPFLPVPVGAGVITLGAVICYTVLLPFETTVANWMMVALGFGGATIAGPARGRGANPASPPGE